MRSLSSRPAIMRSLGPVVSLREFQLLRGRVLAVRLGRLWKRVFSEAGSGCEEALRGSVSAAGFRGVNLSIKQPRVKGSGI